MWKKIVVYNTHVFVCLFSLEVLYSDNNHMHEALSREDTIKKRICV